MFKSKSPWIAIVGTLVIVFVGGFTMGNLFPSAMFGGGLNKAQTEKVKKFFPVTPELTAISGAIKSIDGNTITIEIAESNNPFDEWPTIRKVTVSNATKIVRTSQKNSKEFQAALDDYTKSVVENIGTQGSTLKPPMFLTPPTQVKEEDINLSDLKGGDAVTVESDHNIKNETQFTAVKVTLGIGGSAMVAPTTSMLPPVR